MEDEPLLVDRMKPGWSKIAMISPVVFWGLSIALAVIGQDNWNTNCGTAVKYTIVSAILWASLGTFAAITSWMFRCWLNKAQYRRMLELLAFIFILVVVAQIAPATISAIRVFRKSCSKQLLVISLINAAFVAIPISIPVIFVLMIVATVPLAAYRYIRYGSPAL